MPVLSAPGYSNVVSAPCNFTPGSTHGFNVFGCLNDDHSKVVRFSSGENLQISGGQASLQADDGSFSFLSVSVDGHTLDTVILNIDATLDGFVKFGSGIDQSGLFALDGSGENFFTITGLGSNPVGIMTLVTYDAQGVETELVADIGQIRIGLVGAVTPIAEPETYALMMAGLATVGIVTRRRKLRK